MNQRALSILGSTGSIGQQTLDLVRNHPEYYRVVALAASTNAERIIAQALEFKPSFVAVADERIAATVATALAGICTVGAGTDAVLEAASLAEAEVVVAAILGFAGLASVLKAIEAGKLIALANKESLIAGGSLLREHLRQSRATIVPVDSEHNGIYQCLSPHQDTRLVQSITLTASGGPFRNRDLTSFDAITPSEAVKHPRWEMGAKISVDSATLINKGLEVIEASYLFDLPANAIGVLIHPESIVHALASFADGSTLAVLYEPDMRVPIFHAIEKLCFHRHVHENRTAKPLNLADISSLHFDAVDNRRFPGLQLCYQALLSGKNAPLVLNAANEVAVQSFLDGKCGFTQIAESVAAVLAETPLKDLSDFKAVVDTDMSARVEAQTWIERHGKTTALS